MIDEADKSAQNIHKYIERVAIMKTSIFAASLFTLLTFFSCASVLQQKEFRYTSHLAFTGSSVSISLNKIDNSPTHELFFRLTEDEKHIKVELKATGLNIIDQKVDEKAFVVVEKLYDKKDESEDETIDLYYVVGQNFDNNWTLQNQLYITSTADDPLTSLTAGIYRIRYTLFEEKEIEANLLIHTNKAPALMSLDFPPPTAQKNK